MQVLYFAWVRTKINKSTDIIDTTDLSIETVADLVEHLRTLGDEYVDAFNDLSALRVAVNQNFVDFDCVIENNDEIALFPPVTGG